MAQTFDKIGAAIPFGGFRGVGLEFAVLKIERVPGSHSLANVERETATLQGYGTAVCLVGARNTRAINLVRLY